MQGRAALWLPLLALLLAFAAPAAAQYDDGIEGEVTGNVTEPADQRDEREGGGDTDRDNGRDLRPLWYFLGALAVVGIAIALFVAMRDE